MENNERGFVNGVAKWETLVLCPVSRQCTVHILTTGEVTVKEIDRMVETLELLKTGFPVRVEFHPTNAETGCETR